MYCCFPTPTTDSNTRIGMIWVTLDMPSAAEECREPSGKCQGIVTELHIVWRVVTLSGTCAPRSWRLHYVAGRKDYKSASEKRWRISSTVCFRWRCRSTARRRSRTSATTSSWSGQAASRSSAAATIRLQKNIGRNSAVSSTRSALVYPNNSLRFGESGLLVSTPVH